jgi:hypothetical protein
MGYGSLKGLGYPPFHLIWRDSHGQGRTHSHSR